VAASSSFLFGVSGEKEKEKERERMEAKPSQVKAKAKASGRRRRWIVFLWAVDVFAVFRRAQRVVRGEGTR
jgi:hypothetical protein